MKMFFQAVANIPNNNVSTMMLTWMGEIERKNRNKSLDEWIDEKKELDNAI